MEVTGNIKLILYLEILTVISAGDILVNPKIYEKRENETQIFQLVSIKDRTVFTAYI